MGKRLDALRDRSFAIIGIIVILISAGALSAAAVIQDMKDNQAASPTATNTQPQPACQRDTNIPAEKLPAPEAYKASGKVENLQTTDLQSGTGETAKAGDCLVMKYYGTLASNGTLFDQNYTEPTGLQFVLGEGQVIQGWDQGVPGMKVGGTRRIVIPAALAYGNSSPSSAIPPNSDLVFVVKLEQIKQQ